MVVSVLAVAFAHAALGDGGLVRVSEPRGPFIVTVFSAPTPLRVGLADVSVLVQRRADETTVLDADVEVALRDADGSLRHTTAATHAAATNKLLYAASLPLPAAGRWTFDVRLRAGATDETVAFSAEVEPAPAPALAYWPYFALPAIAIALFALREWLRPRP